MHFSNYLQNLSCSGVLPPSSGKSEMFLAIESMESSQRNGRIQNLLDLWLCCINCFWFRAVYLLSIQILMAVRNYFKVDYSLLYVLTTRASS